MEDVQEYQSDFYYPTREEIQDRRDEEKQSKSESLKQETTTDNQQNTEKRDAEIEDAIIKGVEGLAEALGCGKTKAQEILNSKVLEKAGIARQIGRVWRISKKGFNSFLKDNPEIFRW